MSISLVPDSCLFFLYSYYTKRKRYIYKQNSLASLSMCSALHSQRVYPAVVVVATRNRQGNINRACCVSVYIRIYIRSLSGKINRLHFPYNQSKSEKSSDVLRLYIKAEMIVNKRCLQK